MPPVLDLDLALPKLASLPLEVHQAGSLVLATGATTGKLLVLKEGAVEVVRDGVRLAEVSEPGAVFGELAALLGQPHTADVRALRRAAFRTSAAFLASFTRQSRYLLMCSGSMASSGACGISTV